MTPTPRPPIGTLCEPPLSGGWRRRRVTEVPPGVEAVRCWDAVDLRTRTTPVVVLDGGAR